MPASVVLTDAAGNSCDANTTVTANTVGVDAHLPTISVGADVSKSTTFYKTATATDVGGSDVNASTYLWTMASGPGTVFIQGSTSLTAAFFATIDGTYVIDFNATDNAGNVGTDSFVLTLDATPDINAPTIDFNSSGAECDYFYITVDVNDDTTDLLEVWSEYNVAGMDGVNVSNITLFAPGQQITISINADEATDYNYTIYVRDSAGNVADYNKNFTTTTCTTYSYQFQFPNTGTGFPTAVSYSDWISTYDLNHMTIWAADLNMNAFLASNGGPVTQRSATTDVNVVYIYNSTDSWVTFPSTSFATYNLYSTLEALNYFVFDLNSSASGKSIRHVTPVA